MIASLEKDVLVNKLQDGQGYRMIDSIAIENFRCYEKVFLDELKTVNIIVGRNGSGKTAFLEALYFTLGSPMLAFKLKTWRGMGGQVEFNDYSESKNALWRDLFYKFDQSKKVEIRFRGTSDIQRRVEITCGDYDTQYVSKQGDDVKEIPAISFQYYHGKYKLPTARPRFTKDGLEWSSRPEPLRGSFFPSTLPLDPLETAGHFSTLSRKGQIEPVVEALRELFPSIQDLSLELNNSTPMVYASVKEVNEKVPIGLISSGVSKMLTYLVSIAAQRGGILIVDEIENGFYYDRMSHVWRSLYKFCKQNEVQLFASTHSAECLRSLESVIEENPDDFSLLRAVRKENRSLIRYFEGKRFLAALEENIEIR